MFGLPLLRSGPQLRSRIKSWRAFGESVAVVPILGAPHDGHAALIAVARGEADRVLAALIPPRDGGDGPSPHESDALRRMDEAGADALYAPGSATFRPAGLSSRVRVAGLAEVLEGEDAPDRFDEFSADMLRLFAQAQPDAAVFCACRWQEQAIARRIGLDFDVCGRVVAADPPRDDDGLSPYENQMLSAASAREAAARLHRTLDRAAAAIAAGAEPDATLDSAADSLAEAGVDVDWLDLRDAATLAELDAWRPDRDARLFAAVTAGGARLTDTVAVGAGAGPLG